MWVPCTPAVPRPLPLAAWISCLTVACSPQTGRAGADNAFLQPHKSAETQNPRLGGWCLGEKPGNWGAPSRWVGLLWAPASLHPFQAAGGSHQCRHLSPPSPTVPAWPSFLSCLALGTEGTEATASHPQARPKESRPLTEPLHREQASGGSQGPPPATLSLDPSPSSGRPPAHRHPPHPRHTTRLPCPPRISCPPRLAHGPMVPLAIHL